MSCDILQSTLDDLSHFAVQPSDLTFEDEPEIGAGGYGEVFLATLVRSSTAPVKVAVKQLRMVQAKAIRRRVALRLARELKVWASANHPNILKLVGFHLSENLGSAQLISPYMSNGSVKDYINKSQPAVDTRLQFARGITSGIHYLHSCHPPICHGDLKPSNVLVNDNIEAVLCDFGLATFITESGASSGLTTSRSPKGSIRYMSPELIQETEAQHSLKSDIWAWACTVFEVVTDSEPYSNANRDVIVMRSLMLGKPPGSVDLLNNVSHSGTSGTRTLDRLKSIIPACWATDPADRPASSEIFNHLAFLHRKEASHRGNKNVPEEQGTRSQVGRHRDSSIRPLAASGGKRASGKPKVIYAPASSQQSTDTSASAAESSIAIAENDIEEDYGLFLSTPLAELPSGSSMGLKLRGDSIDAELAATRYNRPSQRRRYRDEVGDQVPDWNQSRELDRARNKYVQLPRTTRSGARTEVLSRKVVE